MSLSIDRTRRAIALGLTASLVVGARAVFAQTRSRVLESDDQAKSLGYRDDARNVDQTRFPEHRPGQMCSNCKVFQGKPSDPVGPCPIFHGRLVSANGWCHSYVHKA